MAAKNIFRQAALDRLASPEQLDLLLEVTTPKGWLALLGIFGLLGAAVLWALLGVVPTSVAGTGILVKKQGLKSISVLAAGQLADILVRPGDLVNRGQVVGHLSLPELTVELTNARAQLRELEEQHRQLGQFGRRDTRLQNESMVQQRHIAQQSIRIARERQDLLARKLATQSRLLQDGLITDQVVQATRDALIQARADAERAQGALKDLTLHKSEFKQVLSKNSSERAVHLAEARRHIGDLEERIRRNSLIESPAAGRVLEVRAQVGALVAAGTPVLMIELLGQFGQGMEAIVYLPGVDGKKVRQGMAAEISPSTVKREEFGSIRGAVTSVSLFPATVQAMAATLGSAELAGAFLKASDTPIELHATLLPSTRTVSGYQWTSPEGPPETVQPGTLCAVAITVRERRPITLIMPFLKEALSK